MENEVLLDEFIEYLVENRVFKWFVINGKITEKDVAERVLEYLREFEEDRRGDDSYSERINKKFKETMESICRDYENAGYMLFDKDYDFEPLKFLISVIGLYAFIYCKAKKIVDRGREETFGNTLKNMQEILAKMGLDANRICEIVSERGASDNG